MKENNENKAKALEENKKNYSSENSTPQNGEDIIRNEDAEKLEGGIKHEDLERPSDHLKVLLVESSAAMVNDLFQINLKRLV